MAKISVIVPIHNAEKYLRACIDSVLAQTFADFELILVNNNSTDCSQNICYEYTKKDNRVTLVDEAKKGVSAARNCGIMQSSGTYLFFLDSDDSIKENMLETIVKNALATDADIVIPNISYVYYNKKDKLIKRFYYPLREQHATSKSELAQLFGEFLPIYLFFNVFKLYKREILIKNNIWFCETLSLGEDLKFNVTYCEHSHECVLLPFPLYEYNHRGVGGLNSKYREDLLSIKLDLQKIILHYLTANELPFHQIADAFYQICINDLFSCIYNIFKNPNYVRSKAKQEFLFIVQTKSFSELLKHKFCLPVPAVKKLFLFLVNTKCFPLICGFILLYALLKKE